MRKHEWSAASLGADADRVVRSCDAPGCACEGLYRAPKGRDRLHDYFWFCLDHVRDYNRGWDYCAGLSENEIEAMVRTDTTWERPSWPMGEWAIRERRLRERVYRTFGESAEEPRPHRPQPRPQSAEELAFAELELEPGTDAKSIKARYRALVKRHHPDANGGDRAAEERLKRINQAYTTLKAARLI